ncbi:MAG TPA: ribosome-associated translation inhibitor RaiA [Actinomycetota bacterium]|nr:ribosome-associated translation inhibitor RaiA [Actinomycetota bacterium]
MDITVHSQHGHIPESLQHLTASKMEVLGKFLTTITSIEVEVDRDGRPNRHNAFLVRVAVATPGPVFRSRVVCDDPVAGIDVAVERLSRRLKEFKRRRSGRPLHSRPKTGPGPHLAGGGGGEEMLGVVESRPDHD